MNVERLAGFLSTQDPFTELHPEACVPLAARLLEVFDVRERANGREATLRAHLKRSVVGQGWDWELVTPAGRVVARAAHAYPSKTDALDDLLTVVRRPLKVDVLYEITEDDVDVDVDVDVDDGG